MAKTTIHTGRVREQPESEGFRVLCDGLWPRGIKKADAGIDLWAKELAPSKDLRSWYHEDREQRHDDFVARYRKELDGSDHDELLTQLREQGSVVLLTDSKDIASSHLPVLEEWLRAAL